MGCFAGVNVGKVREVREVREMRQLFQVWACPEDPADCRVVSGSATSVGSFPPPNRGPLVPPSRVGGFRDHLVCDANALPRAFRLVGSQKCGSLLCH